MLYEQLLKNLEGDKLKFLINLKTLKEVNDYFENCSEEEKKFIDPFEVAEKTGCNPKKTFYIFYAGAMKGLFSLRIVYWCACENKTEIFDVDQEFVCSECKKTCSPIKDKKNTLLYFDLVEKIEEETTNISQKKLDKLLKKLGY